MKEPVKWNGNAPEILAWEPAKKIDSLHGSDRLAYEAAMWEGWPALRQGARRI